MNIVTRRHLFLPSSAPAPLSPGTPSAALEFAGAAIVVSSSPGGPVTGVWNPLPADGEPASDVWDLLASLTCVEDADLLVGLWMRPVLTTDLAAFYAPDAAPLLASLLWAARCAGETLAVVLDWIEAEDSEWARRRLLQAGQDEVAADVQALAELPAETRAGMWSLIGLTVAPLRDPATLATVNGRSCGASVPAAPPATPEVGAIACWRPAGGALAGLTDALVDQLRRQGLAAGGSCRVAVTTMFGGRQ